MATTDSSATPQPSTDEDPCFACYDGWVYLGFEAEQDGELVEVTDRVPCRRCTAEAPAHDL